MRETRRFTVKTCQKGGRKSGRKPNETNPVKAARRKLKLGRAWKGVADV